MTQWQQLGYVQDSDDEDGTIAFDEEESRSDLYDGAAPQVKNSLVVKDDIDELANKVRPSESTNPSGPLNANLDSSWLQQDGDEASERQLPGSQSAISNACTNFVNSPRAALFTSTDVQKSIIASRENLPESGVVQEKGLESQKDIFDIPSSPLSSIASTPSLSNSPRIPHWDIPHEDVEASGLSARPPDRPGFAVVVPSLRGPTPHLQDENRRFRRRNPIQLHPYLLENEHYRQSLRARGLRPIAFERQDAVQEAETQDAVSQLDQQNSGSGSSSPLSGSSQLSAERGSSSQLIQHPEQLPLDLASDDDLPDLDAILQRRIMESTQHRHKRRKVTHPHQRREERRDTASTSKHGSFPRPNEIGQTESVGSTNMISTRRRVRKKFKVPRGLSPPPLPTPDATSELQGPRSEYIEFDSESDAGDDSLHEVETLDQPADQNSEPENVVPVIINSSPTSGDGANTSRDFKAVQRRIKGVLPASWLRLDKQAQESKDARKSYKGADETSPSKSTAQKGVARRIPHAGRGDMSTLNNGLIAPPVFEVSDGSDSDAQTSPLRDAHPSQPMQVGSRERRRDSLEEQLVDVEEYDWIDPMNSPVKRQRPKSFAKRQGKLTDLFANANRKPLTSARQISTTRKHHAPEGTSRRSFSTRGNLQHKKTKRVVQLSIVDADNELQPDFIRLAMRQAKQRQDLGRHSPTNKIIQLHTTEDTAEANETLRQWRSGKLVQRTKIAHRKQPERPVLGETSANLQSTSTSSSRPNQVKQKRSAQSMTRPQTLRQANFHKAPLLRQTKLQVEHREAKPSAPQHAFNVSASKARKPSRSQIRAKPSRPGQLEGLQTEDDARYPQSTFQRNLLNLEDHYKQDRFVKRFERNPLIERFLDEDTASITAHDDNLQKELVPSPVIPAKPAIVPRRRKRTPKQFVTPNGADNVSFLEANSTERVNLATERPKSHGSHPLEGLEYGLYYVPDCGVSPLPRELCFHSSTFIGSGELKAALALVSRDLEKPSGSCFLTINNSIHRWSSWTEEMATDLSEIERQAANVSTLTNLDGLDGSHTVLVSLSSLALLLRSVVSYFAKNLHFLDAIDRIDCVERSIKLIGNLFESFASPVKPSVVATDASSSVTKAKFRCLTYVAVLAAQVAQISNHSLVHDSTRSHIKSLYESIHEKIIYDLLYVGDVDRKDFLACHRRTTFQAECIGPDECFVEGTVVAYYNVRQVHGNDSDFWTYVGRCLSKQTAYALPTAKQLEDTWSRLFSLLPLLDFDVTGLHNSNAHSPLPDSAWTIVKSLLTQTFELYSKVSCSTSSINAYIRAVLSRCHILIRTWRWQNCEPVTSTIFDFFARRGLSLLDHEDSRGPAAFLETNNKDQSPRIDPGDRSFEIFLKVLYAGLVSMRNVYSNKKIRNIAWRYIPNHGRVHKKEDDLHEDDLGSLRNHHDLLNVLYMASPPQFRINLGLIQNLVELESSHMEVCRVNVRSWVNLARFELSSIADKDAIIALASWFRSMLEQLKRQHQLARTEAQTMFDSASVTQKETMTQHMLESTIATNQRQVEAVLCTALGCLANVLQDAKDSSAVLILFRDVHIATIYQMFDQKLPRLTSVIIEALKVHQVYSSRAKEEGTRKAALSENEDSQDYGDWPELDNEDDFDGTSTAGTSASTVESADALQNLLSNCFGVDMASDDSLATKLVETWTEAASQTVRAKQRTWSFYLESHSSGSWHQLRDTDQTRKFSPYFLAILLEREPTAYLGNELEVISQWLVSLVDRESMLKYQHRLTSSIINLDMSHDWTENLPFEMDKNGKYNITLGQLRERRLNTISAVLANVRRIVERTALDHSEALTQLRRDSITLVKHMMNAMKRNYEQTQQESSTRGAYVDFVQKVVEFLQENTSEFCPVDRFFTDSVAFPLPAVDPAYVVGRLKSYSLKLSDVAMQKKLAMFLISTSERAAIDGHQEYFTDQLLRSLESNVEQYESSSLLRQFFIEAVYCPFVQTAFQSPCGWIVAQPIIKAAEAMLENILFGSSLTDKPSAATILDITDTLLQSSKAALKSWMETQSELMHPGPASTTRMLFRAIAAAVSPVDYWTRSDCADEKVISIFEDVEKFAEAVLSSHPNVAAWPPETSVKMSPTFENVSSFCARELSSALAKNWAMVGDECFMLRGSSRRKVVVNVGTKEEETVLLMEAAQYFLDVLHSKPFFGGNGPPLATWQDVDLLI